MSNARFPVTPQFQRDELAEKTVEYLLSDNHGVGRIQVDRQMTTENEPTGLLFLTVVHDYGRYPKYFQFRCALDQRRADLIKKHSNPEIADFLLLDQETQ